MKTLRIFLVMVLLVAVADYLTPILSARNTLLFSMIRDNCGYVPIFFDQVFNVTSRNSPRVIEGFVRCGAGFIGFLVVPGFLTVFVKIYRFVKHG